jgi:hypothetical protein
MLFLIEILLLSIVASLLVTLVAREVYCFWRWKRTLGRMEHHEWARRVSSIRENGESN